MVSVPSLMDNDGGEIFSRADIVGLIGHFQSRAKLILLMFFIGFIGGYPGAGEAITWLLQADGFLPDGVQVIILQPMEIVLLQLRIATQIGFSLAFFTIICDLGWNGRSILAKARRNVSDVKITRFKPLIQVLIAIFILGLLGALYAKEILIPMLLDYLAADAASSGLSNTWQLQSWIGFIAGLFFGSIIGFQVPILVILLLRAGLIEHQTIVENRGLFWFSALFLGAMLSPPDPLSLFLVGGPILILIELALLSEKYFQKY